MRYGVVASTVATAAGAVALALVTARWSGLHWGATTGEVDEVLPGDDVVPGEAFVATRAITIDAVPERVWPWVVQLGQGRGGFYSYDWLENLVGCDIHSADEVVERWQHVAPGDTVRLHPEVALAVASVDPGHSLVLTGGPDAGTANATAGEFSWAFVVRKHAGATTRLLVRERYAVRSPWSRLFLEPLSAASSLMSQKMLRGIRDRAERRDETHVPVGT